MSRAALYSETGGPDVLFVDEVPDPEPTNDQVVVRVGAAGLNPYDGKVRSGFIPSKAPFPRRVGSDLAGVVERVGPDAAYGDGTPIAVGDRVLGHGAGAVAELAVARAGDLARVPEGLSIEVAGGLHVAGLTAVSCLATVPVGAGDTLLVGGATGGVGMIASQLAARAGARVIGTASERNHDFLRSIGVEPVAYGEGLADRVAALSSNGGSGTITAVYDCHGREALDAGVALGVPRDRIVSIAGYAAVDELGVMLVEREARTTANLAKLADDVAAGRVVVPIAGRFGLDQVQEAFAALESSHAPGKIVVIP